MRKSIVWTLVLCMLTAANAWAGASKEEAQAFVRKAIEYYKANGKEKSLAEFSNPHGQFVKGELYLTVWDFNCTQIAHGVNPKLIGKNLCSLKDTDGKEFVKDFMELAKKSNSGWVSYKWMNAEAKKIQTKHTYLEKVGDIMIGCGVYESQ